jgi:hypothetical protein
MELKTTKIAALPEGRHFIKESGEEKEIDVVVDTAEKAIYATMPTDDGYAILTPDRTVSLMPPKKKAKEPLSSQHP